MSDKGQAHSPIVLVTEQQQLGSSLEISEPISHNNILLQGAEEQALESHEVIELQTFSERKAWIEDKIKVNALVMNWTKDSHHT